MKKYKFITIKQANEELFEGQPVYRVYNNKSGDQLAIISYFKQFKAYVFSSKEHCVFDLYCLKDVMDFMKNHCKTK
jgi:hypothetical protein